MTTTPTTTGTDFKVADISPRRLGPQGDPARRAGDARADVGPRGVRRRSSRSRARGSSGSLHMTIQTAVLIETLVALGAEVRWARATSSRPRTTPPPRSPSGPRGRREPAGRAGLRLEGRDARGVLVVHRAGARLADGTGPNMIVDDGGDATLLIHKGVEFEAAGAVPSPETTDNEEFKVILGRCQRRSTQDDPSAGRTSRGDIRGVTEETTTGVHRLYEMQQAGTAAVPGDQRQRLGHEVASSTTSTAAATRWSTASTAPPT